MSLLQEAVLALLRHLGQQLALELSQLPAGENAAAEIAEIAKIGYALESARAENIGHVLMADLKLALPSPPSMLAIIAEQKELRILSLIMEEIPVGFFAELGDLCPKLRVLEIEATRLHSSELAAYMAQSSLISIRIDAPTPFSALLPVLAKTNTIRSFSLLRATDAEKCEPLFGSSVLQSVYIETDYEEIEFVDETLVAAAHGITDCWFDKRFVCFNIAPEFGVLSSDPFLHSGEYNNVDNYHAMKVHTASSEKDEADGRYAIKQFARSILDGVRVPQNTVVEQLVYQNHDNLFVSFVELAEDFVKYLPNAANVLFRAGLHILSRRLPEAASVCVFRRLCYSLLRSHVLNTQVFANSAKTITDALVYAEKWTTHNSHAEPEPPRGLAGLSGYVVITCKDKEFLLARKRAVVSRTLAACFSSSESSASIAVPVFDASLLRDLFSRYSVDGHIIRLPENFAELLQAAMYFDIPTTIRGLLAALVDKYVFCLDEKMIKRQELLRLLL